MHNMQIESRGNKGFPEKYSIARRVRKLSDRKRSSRSQNKSTYLPREVLSDAQDRFEALMLEHREVRPRRSVRTHTPGEVAIQGRVPRVPNGEALELYAA